LVRAAVAVIVGRWVSVTARVAVAVGGKADGEGSRAVKAGAGACIRAFISGVQAGRITASSSPAVRSKLFLSIWFILN
jgi:hypothetical protein